MPFTHALARPRSGFRFIGGAALLSLSLCASLPVPAQQAPGTIVTVAGNGTYGFSGDGGPATQAQLKSPVDVAVDRNGQLYIVDVVGANPGQSDDDVPRVRKVDSQGVITTFAGGGTAESQGDDPATSIAFSEPTRITFDDEGNLFVADYDQVYQVDTSGLINVIFGGGEGTNTDGTPISGTDFTAATGIATDVDGNLYLLDEKTLWTVDANLKVTSRKSLCNVVEVPCDPATSTPDATGKCYDPDTACDLEGVSAVSAGNVLVADLDAQHILAVTANGASTPIAGTAPVGKATNGDPYGDFGGDGGPALSAKLNLPAYAVADAAGNLFIADTMNNRVRKVTPNGVITTVAGNSPPHIPEWKNGVFVPYGGFSGDGGPATAAELNAPFGLAIDGAGNLYIADTGNRRVRKVFGVAASGLIAGVPITSPPPAVKGDVTGDGKVNIQDAILVLRNTVGLADLAPDQISAGDVTGDGRINIQDATLILRLAVGL